MKSCQISRILLLCAFFIHQSCNDEDQKPGLRARIDYSSLTPGTSYPEKFVDANGLSTVELADGNNRLKMFQALNYYSMSSISASTKIDGTVLESMFENTASPFVDISTPAISVSGDQLNSSGVQLRNVAASSFDAADAEVVRQRFSDYFTTIESASKSLSMTASAGQAGKSGNYLLDERGLEVAELIQKSLIGAVQLDYISNVLLDEGLKADNYQLVGKNNYTQLEHNWDIAYGLLTLNPVYLDGATDAALNTVEFGAGEYIWEYNKETYTRMYPAFLKGRAAIVNNDRDQYMALATFIRIEFEKTIANAAVACLKKWKNEPDVAGRAHAIGQGAGFIYSLRFAELHEANALYSNTILENLIGTGGGFWDLNDTKVNDAIEAIEIKFND